MELLKRLDKVSVMFHTLSLVDSELCSSKETVLRRVRDIEFYIEDLTWVLLLLQIKRIKHECSSCCRYRGSNMSAPLVADIEDLT